MVIDTDLMGMWDGDDFVVPIMANTKKEAAETVAIMIRNAGGHKEENNGTK